MPDSSISLLPTASAPLPTDVLPIVSSGVTAKITLAALLSTVTASAQTELGYYSVKDANVFGGTTYQAAGNNTTDDTAAIQGIIANAPAGSVIYFPPGKYKLTAPLAITKSLYLVGGGRYAVTLYISTTSPMLTYTGVRGFGATGITFWNNLGPGISMYGTDAIVGGVVQQGYGASADAVFTDCYFVCNGGDAVLFNNHNGAYFKACTMTQLAVGGIGFHFTGTGTALAAGKPSNGVGMGYTLEVHITDCVVGGPSNYSDTSSAAFLFDYSTDGQYIENCDIFGWGFSFLLEPRTRTATYSDSGTINTYTFNGFTGDIYVSNCTPNSANLHNVYLLPADATSTINSISFSNCQIAGADINVGGVGVLMDSTTYALPGNINGIMFSNCGVGQNAFHGVQIRGCNNVTFIGGYITGNQRYNSPGGAYQIYLDGGASTNILFSGVNSTVPFNQTFITPYPINGLYVSAHNHTYLKFRDCNFTGTTTALTNNLPNGNRNIGALEIRACPGINPLGWGNAPVGFTGSGSSGYNQAPCDIMVTISGGAGVTIGIGFVGGNYAGTGLSSGTFLMPPGSYMTLGYTSAPSIVGYAL